MVEMKIKYLQKWTDVIYGSTGIGRFKEWSNIVLGKGDETLRPSKPKMLGFWNWLKKNWRWKKFIILMPYGDLETEFKMGFYSKQYGICKISSAIRKISDGPFAMRMGPEDCYFFVVGTEEIVLEIVGYIRKDLWLY